MTGRKRSYMNYLNDTNSPLPKSTQYSHRKKVLVKHNISTQPSDEKSANSDNLLQDNLKLFESLSEEPEESSFHFSEIQNIYNDIFHNNSCEYADNEENDTPENADLHFDDFGLEGEEEDEENYEFEDESIDFVGMLYDGAEMSVHELAVLLITLKTAFNVSAVAIDFIIKILRMALPKVNKSFRCIKDLYVFFSNQEVEMKRHFYCSNCLFYIGEKRQPSVPGHECPMCKRSKFDYFVDIPLEKELQKVLTNNWKHLEHRFKKNGNQKKETISDIYDGKMYKKYFDDGNFLSFHNNISLLGNTDGVAIFRSSSFSVWPIYMVVNELPPNIRFRRENRILCGLWFGKEKPNFPTFFKPFTELLWKLYTDGFVVKDENGDDQNCKAMLLQMTCDSPAKCLFQDFIQYNGYYGCPYCLHSGTYDKTGHCQTYPYISDSEHGHEEERTHANTVELARIARINMSDGKKKYAEKGVKGMSWGFSLPNFDIINSMCLDYMHAVLLGVMKRLLNFWFGKDKNEIFSISNRRSEVEQRLMEIKPPNNITRSPRTLDELKHWKASEYRSFLLFYGPVCLYGILLQPYYDHFMLLSTAVWLLLQQEIRKDDLDNAAKHFQYFCYQMSALYGDASNSFSVHLLLHIPNTVRQNGPLWCQSCFWFEDYNGELRQFFHSSQHPDSQVARAVHIVQKLPEMVKLMNPESAAAIMQRKMTSDRYKVKIIKYVHRGICVVGKAEEANLSNHKNVFSLVKLEKPSFTGIPLKYKRALLQGEMIHSKIYQKVSKRNSFTVEYQNITNKDYGEILFFLGLGDDYYAVVNKFTKKTKTLTEDHTTGPTGGHLFTFEKQREQDVVLVSLSDINGKVICMDVKALEFTVVGMFPNKTEKD